MTIPSFDPVIHAPNRLQICAFLVPLAEAEFKALREALQVSDSVLSKHIKQLEDAGYATQRKSKFDGRQRTWVCLTEAGRLAFAQHVTALKQLANLVD